MKKMDLKTSFFWIESPEGPAIANLTRRMEWHRAVPERRRILAHQLISDLADCRTQRIDDEVDLPCRDDQRRREHIEMADRPHQKTMRLAFIRDALGDVDFVGQLLFRLLVGHIF